ncbi:type II toxin-antitoxin system RelE/ParE family toxin [Pandoraea sputorum]|uniref:type II toxin-antitoxin system RelE/ParE family toxin n=1 Tax=Pandoraea sputorum TaxID=93222 RepID=UPI002AF6B8B9|nr:type II toxin-antitoxin system RelE/ParE family toxin [Pandoraea sputorum]
MPLARKGVSESCQGRVRVFKTRRFSSDARAAEISDDELYRVAMRWASEGVCGNALGAGVVKARLRDGGFRALLVEKEEVWIVFAHLFDKQDEKNVGPKALKGFKKLAKDLKGLPRKAFEAMLQTGALKEIYGK